MRSERKLTMNEKKDPAIPVQDMDADELVTLIDELMASGTQHVNLDAGDITRVTTVNSTECGKNGPCAVPNFDSEDADEELFDDEDEI